MKLKNSQKIHVFSHFFIPNEKLNIFVWSAMLKFQFYSESEIFENLSPPQTRLKRYMKFDYNSSSIDTYRLYIMNDKNINKHRKERKV